MPKTRSSPGLTFTPFSRRLLEASGTFSRGGIRLGYKWDGQELEYEAFVGSDNDRAYSGTTRGSSLNAAIHGALKSVQASYSGDDSPQAKTLSTQIDRLVKAADSNGIDGYYVSEGLRESLNSVKFTRVGSNWRAVIPAREISRLKVPLVDIVTGKPYSGGVSFLFDDAGNLLTIEQSVQDRSGRLYELTLQVFSALKKRMNQDD